MFIYNSESKEGELDIQTRAFYIKDDGVVSINQYLFKKDRVVSSSQIDLTIEQLYKILTVASNVKLKYFYDVD